MRFPSVSSALWRERMANGEVLDASGVALHPNSSYTPHQKIFYYRSVFAESRIPFDEVILYRDDYVVVVDKPHFLPVTPSGNYLQETLLVRLKRTLGIDTLAPMHRIDCDTAGLVIFTIDPATRSSYQELFRNQAVTKVYYAVAPYRADLPSPFVYRSRLIDGDHFMQVRETSGLTNAQTTIQVQAIRNHYALYQLSPATGYRHQLRVQMAALRLPICNDRLYPILQPKPGPAVSPNYSQPLQLLAASLTFIDPISRIARCFKSRRTLEW